MKTLTHILSFEWKSLWRSNVLKVLLLIMISAGIYGIYFGKIEVNKQQARITQVQEHEKKQFNHLLNWAELDTTFEANREKYQDAVTPSGIGFAPRHFTYYVVHELPPLAGLNLGQRDLFPIYYGITPGDMAREVNVSELANPMKLLTGNFDLSYVIVFLLPLFIVALFYNIYAAEKEEGTLPLLQSQPISVEFVLFTKGLSRFIVVILLASSLLVLAFIIQGISFIEHATQFGYWLFVIYIYCLVWTLLMGIIVWFRQDSALSGMLGLGVWLIFTIITPALLNLIVLEQEPIPNRSEAIHAIRNLNDQMWQSPKSFVFDQFYPEHPEYAQSDTTDFNKWYYAGFIILDNKANAMNAEFEEQIQKRNEILKKWEWLAPAAMIHEKLSKISDTDRNSHLDFFENVQEYHHELKEIYYPKIFASENFELEDLKKLYSKLDS